MNNGVLRLQVTPATEAEAIRQACAVLAAGGVIVAPTETVYGLMCCWEATAARERIVRLKRRAPEKHFQMLADSLATAGRAGLCLDGRLERLAAAFWPGPLTVVGLGRDGGTIGVRLPRHRLVLELVRSLRRPLAATSANLSGRPAAVEAEAATADLEGAPDLVLDDGPIAAGGGVASTVVDLATPGEARILRQGPISAADLQRVLGPAVSVVR